MAEEITKAILSQIFGKIFERILGEMNKKMLGKIFERVCGEFLGMISERTNSPSRNIEDTTL